MKLRFILAAMPLVFAVANCAHLDGTGANAQTAPSKGDRDRAAEPKPLKDSYTWHDGEREHRVWVDPDLIAEFRTTSSAGALPGAKILSESSPRAQGIRLWTVEPGTKTDTALRSAARDQPTNRYSPVLHDSPSTDGPMRLLPGNVIAVLDPSWNQDTVAQWAARHKVRIVRTMNLGPNMVVLEAAPGLPALELANDLYRSGEVKAAFPDWWTEKTLK